MVRPNEILHIPDSPPDYPGWKVVQYNAAHRAAADPAVLVKAARIVRAALERRVLLLEDLTGEVVQPLPDHSGEVKVLPVHQKQRQTMKVLRAKLRRWEARAKREREQASASDNHQYKPPPLPFRAKPDGSIDWAADEAPTVASSP